MHKVLEFVSTVHDLCAVLGMDFFSTVTEVHPSLNDSTSVQSKSISNDTLSRLAKTVLALKEDKKQRLHKVACLESLSLSLSLSLSRFSIPFHFGFHYCYLVMLRIAISATRCHKFLKIQPIAIHIFFR